MKQGLPMWTVVLPVLPRLQVEHLNDFAQLGHHGQHTVLWIVVHKTAPGLSQSHSPIIGYNLFRRNGTYAFFYLPVCIQYMVTVITRIVCYQKSFICLAKVQCAYKAFIQKYFFRTFDIA